MNYMRRLRTDLIHCALFKSAVDSRFSETQGTKEFCSLNNRISLNPVQNDNQMTMNLFFFASVISL